MTVYTDTPEDMADPGDTLSDRQHELVPPRPDWALPEKPEEACHECGGELLPRLDDSDGFSLYWDCLCGHTGEHGWLIEWPFADGQPAHYGDLYALGFQPLD